jgi:hypothetical protein
MDVGNPAKSMRACLEFFCERERQESAPSRRGETDDYCGSAERALYLVSALVSAPPAGSKQTTPDSSEQNVRWPDSPSA